LRFGTLTNSAVYINGVSSAGNTLIASAIADPASFTYSIPMIIGSVTFSAGRVEHFDGSIDEVRIFNVAKTADEIKQLYRMGATPRGLK
jgi:hypothetical protein